MTYTVEHYIRYKDVIIRQTMEHRKLHKEQGKLNSKKYYEKNKNVINHKSKKYYNEKIALKYIKNLFNDTDNPY